MKRKHIPLGVFSAFAMLLMILDSKTALSGAQEGLSLCIRTVIPSLFPFFVLSSILTRSLMGTELTVLRPLSTFCRIPRGGEALILTGLLGGYPVGASAVADAYKNGQLSRAQANRMLAFCNNAGPAFLFGMASALFPSAWMPWALWAIHIVSALLVSRIFPAHHMSPIQLDVKKDATLSGAVITSVRTMATVCGWVILFRVVIAFFSRWFGAFLPKDALVLLSGFLELSNGCCALAEIGNISQRFIFCSAMLGFGGLCVYAQTSSVTNGLDLRWYLIGKLLQTGLSIALSSLLFYQNGWLTIALLLLIFVFFRKRSRFPAKAGV